MNLAEQLLLTVMILVAFAAGIPTGIVLNNQPTNTGWMPGWLVTAVVLIAVDVIWAVCVIFGMSTAFWGT